MYYPYLHPYFSCFILNIINIIIGVKIQVSFGHPGSKQNLSFIINILNKQGVSRIFVVIGLNYFPFFFLYIKKITLRYSYFFLFSFFRYIFFLRFADFVFPGRNLYCPNPPPLSHTLFRGTSACSILIISVLMSIGVCIMWRLTNLCVSLRMTH